MVSGVTNWHGLRRLYGALFLDIFAVGLIVPLLTPLSKELGASPGQIGMLSSVYGIVQIMSGPHVGALSDRTSACTVLVLCTLGGVVGYGLLTVATTVPVVVLSRIIVGIFRQFSTVAKAVACRLSSPDDRSAAVAYLYGVTGLGFSIAPAVGGIAAARVGIRPVLGLACGVFIINAVVVSTAVDGGDSGSARVSGRSADDISVNAASAAFSLEPTRAAFLACSLPVRRMMVVRVLIGLSVMLLRSSLSLMLEYGNFDVSFGIKEKGLVISGFSILGTLSHFVVVRLAKSVASEKRTIVISATIMAIATLAAATASDLISLFVALSTVSVSSALLKANFQSTLSKVAGKEHFGAVLGVANTVFSLTRAISPMVSGVLTESGGPSLPCFVAGGCGLIAAGLAVWLVPDVPDLEKKDK